MNLFEKALLKAFYISVKKPRENTDVLNILTQTKVWT